MAKKAAPAPEEPKPEATAAPVAAPATPAADPWAEQTTMPAPTEAAAPMTAPVVAPAPVETPAPVEAPAAAMTLGESALRVGLRRPDQAPAPSVPPQQVPFFHATFAGMVFVSGSRGNEQKPFQEEVRVPQAWAVNPELHPVGVFIKHYAPRLFKQVPGYDGVAMCELIDSEGLPSAMAQDRYLEWCGSYSDLAQFVTTRGLEIRLELFPSSALLRQAIKRAIKEPEAFKREQDEKSRSGVLEARQMNAELAALGY